jgi:hypothetical protein
MYIAFSTWFLHGNIGKSWKTLEISIDFGTVWPVAPEVGTGGGHRSQLVSESHMIVHHRKESKSHELDLRTPRTPRTLSRLCCHGRATW